jgi:hypothetical protein
MIEATVAGLRGPAQESRFDIFRMLVQAGPGGLLGATLSFHLNR